MAEPPAGRLWGVVPRQRLVGLDRLDALRAPGPALTPGFERALVESNPWRAALARLGCETAVDPRMVPIEEGESSLNANSSQGLAVLLALIEGGRAGAAPTVAANLTAGNHPLSHTLELFAEAAPDPPAVRQAVLDAFAAPAVAAAEGVLARCGRPAQKAFARLPEAVRRRRALRLPGGWIAAPEPGRLERLGGELELGPELTAELVAARRALDAVGLGTAADLMVVLRGLALHRLAALAGHPRPGLLPATFEHLVLHGTGEGFAGRTLEELAAALNQALGRALGAVPAGGRPGAERRVWSGRYRLLNLFDPPAVLTRGGGAGDGRGGWETLQADWETGRPLPPPGWRELPGLTVAELFERGFGLSGKLIYTAAREVNGGAVCNLVLRVPSDVFAPLAEPGHAGRVLAFGRLRVGREGFPIPGSDRIPPLDLLWLRRWLGRCPEPAAALGGLLDAARRAADPEAPPVALLLGEPPAFRVLEA